MTRTSAPALRDPSTPEEWQQAADAAHACLALAAARAYGLVSGGPVIDAERCEEILQRAAVLGIQPAADAVERLVQELA